MKVFFALLVFLAIPSISRSNPQNEIKDFDELLASLHVTTEYSQSGYDALQKLLNLEIENIKTALTLNKEQLKKKEIEEGKDYLEILTRAQEELSQDDLTLNQRTTLYRNTRSLLYSILSEVKGPNLSKGILSKIKIGLNLLKQIFTRMPFETSAQRLQPLSVKDASQEAWSLIDPNTGREFGRPEELAGLSPFQVAQLDVNNNNPSIYSAKELARIRSTGLSPWQFLEKKIEAMTSKALGQTYRIDEARRVLKFKVLKDSATSPKFIAKDRFGFEWKVKLGEEVQTEPVVGRLYLSVGGRYTDLVYANQGGVKDLVVILEEKDPKIPQTDCTQGVSTVEKLKSCFFASKYNFLADPYILNTGSKTLTPENVDEILTNLPPKERSKYLGREYLVFSETSVEFKPSDETMRFLGATPLGQAGALEDRAKRGLSIFTLWIRNKDAKDDNSKGAYIFPEHRFEDYMHDMGASMGGMIYSGHPNTVKVGSGFVTKMFGSLFYWGPNLYWPKAFKVASFADSYWMAQRIAQIPKTEIQEAMLSVPRADFYNQAFIGKLILRRNRLAEVYGIEAKPMEPGLVQGAGLSSKVSLDTPQDRLAAVRRYHLELAALRDGQSLPAAAEHLSGLSASALEIGAVQLLERLMSEAGIKLDGRGLSHYSDTVIMYRYDKDGFMIPVIPSCEESVLVSFLEATISPAGLSRRIQRRNDYRTLKTCVPSKPN